MSHKVTLIPGDGIGPSVTEAAVRVIEATGVDIEWESVKAGMEAYEQLGNPLPDETIESIKRNKTVLKGPLGTPVGDGFLSVNVQLRKLFNLCVNFRPVVFFDGVQSRYKDVDLIVFRQNTEDLYADEASYTDDRHIAAQITGHISYDSSYKFFEYVFCYARENNRKKVTVGHKANIFKMYHGIFLKAARDISFKYPEIQYEEVIIDALSMKLVLDPTRYDILATTNLFGDILSDMCAGFVGGLGMAPGANIGSSVAIFEAVHGSAPDIAGKDLANPSAVILSAVLMLDHLNESIAAKKIRSAIVEVIKEGKNVTRDLNPVFGVTTTKMTDAIIERIKRA